MATRHTAEQRAFIVRKLAAFCPSLDICQAFKAQWRDTDCQEADVLAVDPRLNPLVGPDLHALFYKERQRVLADPESDPFTAQKARLIVLSDQVDAYMRRGALTEARAVLRQIAEETGEVSKGGKATGGGKDASATPEFKSIKVTHEVVYPPPRDQ